MGKLKERLLEPKRRPAVIKDCCLLIEDEVNRKTGLAGLVIKGGFKVVRAMSPNKIENLVEWLIDEFIENLDPIVEAHTGSEPLPLYLGTRKRAVAGAMLAITDAKARKSSNQTLKTVYEKLRPYGERHVEEATPGIARLIEKHLKA